MSRSLEVSLRAPFVPALQEVSLSRNLRHCPELLVQVSGFVTSGDCLGDVVLPLFSCLVLRLR